MRKLSALLLVLALCISLFGCGNAEPAETTAPATQETLAETTAATEYMYNPYILYCFGLIEK